MSSFAFSTSLQILNVVLLIVWIVLALIALIKLSGKELPATPKAIWVLIILCVPILGPIAFFIIKPEGDDK